MAVQSQPFSDAQTAIPTPYTSEAHAAPEAPRAAYAAPEYAQARMFTLPDVMRGQLHLGTDDA